MGFGLDDITSVLYPDEIFGSKIEGEGFKSIPSTSEQDAARNYYMTVMQGNTSPTRTIAGMSGAETKGMELLNQFLGQPASTERQSALSFLTGLLDQPVDVTQLPEIKALMSSIENETGNLVNSAMRRTQLAGMGTSGPQGSAVGRELARGQTSMVAALAPYLSQVRGNQLTAANLINSLVSGGESSAMNKIGAATSYGSLPRTIEQAKSDAEFQKIMTDLQAKYGAAGNLLGETTSMYNPGMMTPSIFQQFAPAIGAGIGAAVACDERVKENIVPIKDALKKLESLKGKTYNYTFRPSNERDAGVMAQDLESVLPEGVIERDGIKFVKLDAIAALLVNAVNELHELVKSKVG